MKKRRNNRKPERKNGNVNKIDVSKHCPFLEKQLQVR